MSAKEEVNSEYTSTQDRILYYLKSGLEKGKRYFKSKYIAKDLGLSPKEVGTSIVSFHPTKARGSR